MNEIMTANITKKWTTIGITKESKAELDRILKLVQKEYPFINGYADLVEYLVWFWCKNNKLEKNVKS